MLCVAGAAGGAGEGLQGLQAAQEPEHQEESGPDSDCAEGPAELCAGGVTSSGLGSRNIL